MSNPTPVNAATVAEGRSPLANANGVGEDLHFGSARERFAAGPCCAGSTHEDPIVCGQFARRRSVEVGQRYEKLNAGSTFSRRLHTRGFPFRRFAVSRYTPHVRDSLENASGFGPGRFLLGRELPW